MADPSVRRAQEPKSSRSAKAAINPYLVEEIAMTRSDVLRARNEIGSASPIHVLKISSTLTGVIAA
jgi:hypothetical protein